MKKILIIQNKRIGDVLISSVIANNFKAKYPDSEVHFLAYDFTHGVIINNPNIDKIISINDKELKKLPVLLKLIRQIRKEKYDIIFDPYSKTQSRLICKFSGAKQTIGHKSRKKFGNWGYYTHPVEISKEKTKNCGKAIEDRIHLLNQAGNFDPVNYEPKIFLSEAEKKENWLGKYATKKVIVLGVLGSTPQKSMPYEYVAQMCDFIAEHYDVNLLFNYAPHQKEEAMKIYEMCKKKENIILDIYAPSIRDFIKLMHQCDALVANEGGTVHIAKALNKPTFTIFSPYVNKDHWASFEDGKFHHSVHLLEMKPDLFDSFTFEERKKIEANPDELYKQLTPELIVPELDKFLKNNL
ncbi:glycosyltransferase family 9 protein [Flavobacterium enshiense]|uniref:glycosyltransferase family 9 protein n=1 Tax=Flavobacterium enshiense TaxID=1341165 RepID=UPI00345D232A